MKVGPISKLLITKTGHRPNQYKKIVSTLLVLCTGKNFQGLDEVIWTRNNLVETDFMPTYPDANRWSATHNVKVSAVNPMYVPIVNGLRPARFEMMEQTHIVDANLQKKLLSEYEWGSNNKS